MRVMNGIMHGVKPRHGALYDDGAQHDTTDEMYPKATGPRPDDHELTRGDDDGASAHGDSSPSK